MSRVDDFGLAIPSSNVRRRGEGNYLRALIEHEEVEADTRGTRLGEDGSRSTVVEHGT